MSASHAVCATPESAGPSLREVRREVAQAADAQILQVVRMIDALPDRGATDAVLDRVRPRLRAMQPARPLRFARLLFMPLDPLIVAPKDWRPGKAFLPRSALMVLARAVRMLIEASGQRACLDHVDRLIEGADTSQTAVIRQAGGALWPNAAIALRTIGADPAAAVLEACTAEWSSEGLLRSELQPTAASLAPILTQALALHDHDHSGAPLSDQALLGMLRHAQAAGARACGMMLSLLTIRVPHAAPSLLAAAQNLPGLRPLSEAAAETVLDWVEGATSAQPQTICESAIVELIRQTALLDALTALPCSGTRKKRVAEMRAHLVNGCVSRFETSFQERLAAPLKQIPQDPAARDAALDTLEGTARTLRRFEVEARRLGGTPKFDGLVRQAGEAIRQANDVSDMDRARLLELMAGPDAALKFLQTSSLCGVAGRGDDLVGR